MTDATDCMTDRFAILLKGEGFVNHILEVEEPSVQPRDRSEAVTDSILDLVPDSSDEASPTESISSVVESLQPAVSGVPGEKLCGHGSKSFARGLVSFSEYAEERGIDDISFEGEAPEGICSHCWSNVKGILDQAAENAAKGITDRIGTVGYRLRWKQKGRAREEWYDIVVRPETTMAELDRLVCRFKTLDDFHLRMYGLEDEYMDSSLNVVPDHQHTRPSDTLASDITIGEIATGASLWEGDRLSLVYDFGTPAHYYCIAKEVYEPAEIDTLLAERDPIAETETAACIDQKRP